MSRKDGTCYCSDRGCPKNAQDMPENCPLKPATVPETDGLVEMLRASLDQHPNATKAKKEKKR